MNDESKMFLVQNPVKLLQGRVQGHLVEGVVRRVADWVLKRDFPLQNFRLQTAQSCHSNNRSKSHKWITCISLFLKSECKTQTGIIWLIF